MVCVELASEIDLDGFRAQARALIAQRVPPDGVHWRSGGQTSLLDEAGAASVCAAAPAPAAASSIVVPAWYGALCTRVVLHRDAERFTLLYRLLWRLAAEPALRHDALDADRVRAHRMAKAVDHEVHRMRAFVRFRPVVDDDDPDRPWYVAWFEPAHRVVESNASRFQRRFASMRWAILTPDACIRWDGTTLSTLPGASREHAPSADDGEALWLTYYRSIFNPARLKLAKTRRDMPARYWPNLPEATLIGELARAAATRTGRMLDAAPSEARPRMLRAVASQRDGHAACEAGLRHDATAHGDAGSRANDAAVPIRSLAELRTATERCRACPIGAHATQAVHGVGPLGAALMLVGEQPGDQEDLHGRPFAGPAGRLLDRALDAAGVRRDATFLTNAVRHFKFEPRGKRRIHKTPAQQEAAACLHWLEQEIDLVQPRALVALGATAARSLLGRAVAVTRERGRWHARDDGHAVFVTAHPSSILRLPPEEQAAAFAALVDDLRRARGGPRDEGAVPAPPQRGHVATAHAIR